LRFLRSADNLPGRGNAGGVLGLITRIRRALGSGVSFALFGLSGLLLAFVVFPVLRRLPGTQPVRQRRCQAVVQRFFRGFLRFTEAIGVLRMQVVGAEALQEPGQLVVANHPTLLDAVFLMSLMPQADCVVKRATLSNPFMRGVIRGTGYLSNDRGGELVEACVERLREGRSLLVFPEGTRSPAGGLGSFRRGAAHVALESGKPLRTVVITCTPPALGRGQKWYDMPDERLEIRIDCRAAFDPAPIAHGAASRGVAARRVTAALRDFYAKKQQNPSL
jgi:1-acyl-sn-glycerol-3-phosphate acyltransferase